MIIGSCSNCGGDVETVDGWAGVNPPRPTCTRCGAHPKRPVIQMEQGPQEAGPQRRGVRLHDNGSPWPTAGWDDK